MKPLSPPRSLGECPQHGLKSHSPPLPLKLRHCTGTNPNERKEQTLGLRAFVQHFGRMLVFLDLDLSDT